MSFQINQLQRPTEPVNAVLDTDTYNEIDDQFALAYFMLSTERIRPQAIYAAPFSNNRASTPAEGMEKSYNEIKNVLNIMGRKNENVFRGSTSYLPDENTPVESEAARDLVSRAMQHSPQNPLYVLAIGAITNVASAILLNPEICKRIVIVFLGGHSHSWPQPWAEFNMSQDVAAGRVVFRSGAPIVQVPCWNVASHLSTTEPELRTHVKGKSPLGDYLYDLSCRVAIEDGGNATWSRIIWDISVVAWFLGEDFVKDMLVPAPLPTYDQGYIHNSSAHFMKVAYYVNRDAIFLDLFKKLTGDTQH
ncbi:MAG: nucleoside hydrolase [Defluviitaleaceae bacterium]|nr:nucleoside hydrolase [Defluviitaleaceae bacterium]